MFNNEKEKILALAVDDHVEVLKALSHPVRLKIVLGLVSGGCCVTDMSECLFPGKGDKKQPVISQQLRILRQCGVLKQERKGKKVEYTLASEQVIKIVHCMFPEFFVS